MKKRILIVDDEQSVLSTLKRLFRNADYEIRYANSGREALELLTEESADLIISDMRMPEMDGAELLSIAKERYPMTERILITGYSDMESTVKAINDGGIYGYISKPWDNHELLSLIDSALEKTHKNRVKNSALKRFHQDNKSLMAALDNSSKSKAESSEQAAQARQALSDVYRVTEQVLINLLDMRCKGEREFAQKLELISRQVGELLGLNENDQKTLCLAARLHGVGKVGLPDSILNSPIAELNQEQLKQFREYPGHSACALMSYEGFQEVAQVIFEQKEYLDGSGYPNQLKAKEISRLGTLLALMLDYAELRFGKTTGHRFTHEESMQRLQEHQAKYDASLFPILSSITLKLEDSETGTATMMPLFALRSGMRLSQDVYSETGILLLPESTVLTEALIGHLCNIERNTGKQLLLSVRFDDSQ